MCVYIRRGPDQENAYSQVEWCRDQLHQCRGEGCGIGEMLKEPWCVYMNGAVCVIATAWLLSYRWGRAGLGLSYSFRVGVGK